MKILTWFAVSYQAILFVSGLCPNHRKNPLSVIENRGGIRFSSSGAADCSWRLQPIPSHHHALMLFIKEANMKTPGSNRCKANLILPSIGTTCRPSTVCRVYVQPNSTCRATDITAKAFRGCAKNIIHLDDKVQKEVRYQATRSSGKSLSFNLLYKFIDCADSIGVATSRTGTRSYTTSVTIQGNGTSSSKETSKQGTNSYSSTLAAVITIIVILVILLVATCVMLLLMYRRKQKAVTFQNPAVVAYVHDRFEDDNGSSHTTDYLEFPRSESETPTLDTVSGGIYAVIAQRGSAESSTTSETVSGERYQNLPHISAQPLTSRNGSLLDMDFSSSCVYATVHKGFKKRSQTTQ